MQYMCMIVYNQCICLEKINNGISGYQCKDPYTYLVYFLTRMCWRLGQFIVITVIHFFFFFLQVYHPNIDLEGNVCLNILREDWKPVLNINTIIYGLYHLFTVFFLISM